MNHYKYIDEIREMRKDDDNREWITCFSDYKCRWVYKIWYKISRTHFIDNQLNKWIDKKRNKDFIFVIQK